MQILRASERKRYATRTLLGNMLKASLTRLDKANCRFAIFYAKQILNHAPFCDARLMQNLENEKKNVAKRSR